MNQQKKWKITNSYNKVEIFIDNENLVIFPKGFLTYILGKKLEVRISISNLKQIIISSPNSGTFGYLFLTDLVLIDFNHLASYTKLTNFIILQWQDEVELANDLKRYCQKLNNTIK